MPDLTPDEELFFATGELPEALAAELTTEEVVDPPPAVEEEVIADPLPEVVPPVEVAAPAPANDAITRLEAQIAALTTKLDAATKPPEPAAPNEVDDPLGAMLHKIDSVNNQVIELKTQLTTEQQNTLLRQQFDQFQASVNAAKASFEAQTPDFKQAYAHIRNLRTEDLRAAGAPEAEIPKILLQDELQLAQASLAKGKNPAEQMYAMAKRYGYTPVKAPPPAAGLPADQKMGILKAGHAAAKLPEKAAADAVLTLEGLKDASSSDLNKLVMDDNAWASIVGGKAKHDIF